MAMLDLYLAVHTVTDGSSGQLGYPFRSSLQWEATLCAVMCIDLNYIISSSGVPGGPLEAWQEDKHLMLSVASQLASA